MSNLGQVLRNNASVSGGVAALLFALAALLVFRALAPPPQQLAWFYDSADGSLYPERRHAVAPTVAPSGSEGWQAVVYACGACTDKTRQIAYLAKYTPELKSAMTAQQTIDPDLLTRGHLVRSRDDTQWHSIVSPQGQAIVSAAANPCGSTPTTICMP